MNKELEGIDAAAVLVKIARDQALTKAEAAVGFDLPYSTIKALTAEAGFPMLGNHFFPSDFKLWRRRKTGLQSAPDSAPRPPRPSADKSYAPRLKHG
jgi:hypothetical protein